MGDVGDHVGEGSRGDWSVGGTLRRGDVVPFDAVFPEIPDLKGHGVVLAGKETRLEVHAAFEEDLEGFVEFDGLRDAPSGGRFDDFGHADGEDFVGTDELDAQLIAPVLHEFVLFGLCDFTGEVSALAETKFGKTQTRRETAHGFFVLDAGGKKRPYLFAFFWLIWMSAVSRIGMVKGQHEKDCGKTQKSIAMKKKLWYNYNIIIV